jgi:hypothetical protein
MQAEKIMSSPRPIPTATASVELSDILRAHAASYTQTRPVNSQQRKVLRDILTCRTPALGGHLETCEKDCGYRRLSFHSCRNRHCPKCQALNKLRWVSRRCQRLLPTRYFHVVLTLPHQLNPLLFRNQRILFNLFFEAASQALLQLAHGWPRLQVLPGFTAILHTWNQELAPHVHLHIVITAGGLNPDGSRWIPAKNNFLVPVRALAKLLRGKFVDGLQEAFNQGTLRFSRSTEHLQKPPAFRRLCRNLRRIKWYGYAKAPFRGPQHVFGYLGHYTHRTAISNRRILCFDGNTVTFRARNNLQPGTYRLVRLPADQFIRRFLLHVLPHGFVRIRHFGLFASRNAPSKWEKASSLLASEHANLDTSSTLPINTAQVHLLAYKQLLHILTGIDFTVCPNCGANLLRLALPDIPENPLLDSS